MTRPAFACDLAEIVDAPDCALCAGCGDTVEPEPELLADAPTDGAGSRYCCLGWTVDLFTLHSVTCPICGGAGKVPETWLRAQVLAPGAHVCDACGEVRRTAYHQARNICAVCWPQEQER
jgi:RecJ-like exonuclease